MASFARRFYCSKGTAFEVPRKVQEGIDLSGRSHYTIQIYALLCFALLCFALLCFALLCFALLCFALLCFALLCFALLCFALLCFALLCFALLCFVLHHFPFFLIYYLVHSLYFTELIFQVIHIIL